MDIRQHRDGVTLKIKVQPRASKDRVVGMLGDAVKVAVTAPAVEGAANVAVMQFLASLLGISRNQVEIVTGHTGRTKLVKFYGVTKDELVRKLV